MRFEKTEVSKAARAGFIFFFCWLSGFTVSYFWVYSGWWVPSFQPFVFLGNQLFFYPQNVLPHGIVAHDASGSSYEVMSAPAAMILSIAVWLFIGFVFGWFTRRLRWFYTVPLAVIGIYVVLFIVWGLYCVFGLDPLVAAP